MKIEIDKICAECGKNFKAKRERKLFCGDICRATFHQNLKSAKTNVSNLQIKNAYDNLRKLMNGSEKKEIKNSNIGNNQEEKMPEGLHWKDQLEWKRNHQK